MFGATLLFMAFVQVIPVSAQSTITETTASPEPSASSVPTASQSDSFLGASTEVSADIEPSITEPPHVPVLCDVVVPDSELGTSYQFTCSEGKTCAYDGPLGVFGCFSTSEPVLTTDNPPVAGHELFTSCLPNVLYTNCGMTCEDTSRVTTCSGASGFGFCGTKFFVSATLTLSQFYCADSESATSTVIWPSTSPLPFKEVSLPPADPPESTTPPYPLPPSPNPSAVTILGPVIGGMAGIAGFILIGAWAAVNIQRLLSKRRKMAEGNIFSTSSASRAVHATEIPSLTRIGLISIIALVISTAFGVAVLAFLYLFWRSPTQEESPLLRSWILNNNLTRIITVSALILRSSIGVQIALAMSMIAAVALEWVLVPLAEAPSWLIQRSGGGSTLTMLRLAVSGLWASSRNPRTVGTAALVVLLSLAELGLQLSSTILISDLSLESVRGPVNMANISVTYTDLLAGQRVSRIPYAVGPPTTYPPFAEVRHEVMPPLDLQRGLDYTGSLHRAMFPFQTEDDRLSLLSYSGWATVIDATFMCMAPQLVDFRMNGTNQTDIPGGGISRSSAFDLSLTMDWDQMDRQLNGTVFHASSFVSTALSADEGSPNLTVHCKFWANSMLTARDRQLPGWGTQYCVPDNGFAHLLVLNLTAGPGIERLSQTDEWSKPRNLSEMIVSSNGAWTVVNLRDLPGWSWSFSLCSHPLDSPVNNPVLLPVNFTTAGLLAPRRVQPDRNTGFDVTNLMEWLRISGDSSASAGLSEQDRGIGSLGDRDNWTQMSFGGGLLHPSVIDFTTLLDSAIKSDETDFRDQQPQDFLMPTFNLQPFSESLPQFKHQAIYPVYAAVLQKILQATNRPALAVQAWWTLLFAASYYDNLPFFDITAPAAVARWEKTLVPVRSSGFAAVLGLAAVHALLMVAVLWTFLQRTRFAVVRDPWAAFLHASEGDIAEAIEGVVKLQKDSSVRSTDAIVSTLTGADMGKMLRKQGQKGVLVGVSRAGQGDNTDSIGVMRQKRALVVAAEGDDEGRYLALKPSARPSVTPASRL